MDNGVTNKVLQMLKIKTQVEDPPFAPHLSDNNYNKKKKDGINYTDFCNYMCIPSNGHLDTHAVPKWLLLCPQLLLLFVIIFLFTFEIICAVV